MSEKICPITNQPCITGDCSSWECGIDKKVEREKVAIVDLINGISLEIAQQYQLGPGETLKLAENISKYIVSKLK